MDVVVDNDVNVMALGEHYMGFPDVDHLMFVKVATGIGCGIISDGAAPGRAGAAGDLGHIQVPHVDAVPVRQRRLPEAVASGPRSPASCGPASRPAPARRRRLAPGGSTAATAPLREAGRTIGEVLASAVSLLNPTSS